MPLGKDVCRARIAARGWDEVTCEVDNVQGWTVGQRGTVPTLREEDESYSMREMFDYAMLQEVQTTPATAAASTPPPPSSLTPKVTQNWAPAPSPSPTTPASRPQSRRKDGPPTLADLPEKLNLKLTLKEELRKKWQMRTPRWLPATWRERCRRR
ncbi:hypothetical protein RI054_07g40000 [Pseudoscourfieldia marina]